MSDTALANIELPDIDPDMPMQSVLETLDKLAFVAEQVRIAKARIETGVIAWIEANDDLINGAIRYYVGPKKTTKCRDNCEALQALLEQFGHEFVGKQFLASGAFKHGAIRKEVDEKMFDRLFVVEEEPELREGVATKRLQKVDTKFLK